MRDGMSEGFILCLDIVFINYCELFHCFLYIQRIYNFFTTD
jgi:hypothetical protein